MTKTILQNLCKDRDYFEFNIKLETNMQQGHKVGDQIAYLVISLAKNNFFLMIKHIKNQISGCYSTIWPLQLYCDVA